MSPISREAASAAAGASGTDLTALQAAACERRNRAFGRTLTYSPKVFLPLTNLCRNRCDYCSYRRSPGDDGEWTMTPGEVAREVDRARKVGCVEALFCLGDTPEAAFPSYRRTLAAFGQARTVDYLFQSGEVALARGLLPHTNAGVLEGEDLLRLKEVNVSLGLMLENVSPRLCEPGMPHHRAPDKRPHVRIAMTHEAGRLKIPFTSGILIGIGETRAERIESLLAIRELHEEHGHIQEVIVQNFRATECMPMAGAGEPDASEVAHAVALARLILPDEVSVQAPPNLNPASIEVLIRSGINDFGGISPVTPDYINPDHPWPNISSLAEVCAREGFVLRPRLPVYPHYLEREGFVHPRLRAPIEAAQARLS